jgi:MYXO-CTERM domain-containing protein
MSGGPRTIEGKKKTFTIDDVITNEGSRDPAWHETPRRWQTNLLVILRQEDTVDANLQSYMTQFDQWTKDDFSRDASRLAAMDTTIGSMPANNKPSAMFTLPASAKKGAVSTFDASGSSDPDGDPLAYVWDFGDGDGTFGEDATVEHEFRKSGDLTVTLTVVDRNGGYQSTEQTLSVAAAASDDGILPGCGCTLTTSKPASLAPLLLLALGLIGLRRRAS